MYRLGDVLHGYEGPGSGYWNNIDTKYKDTIMHKFKLNIINNKLETELLEMYKRGKDGDITKPIYKIINDLILEYSKNNKINKYDSNDKLVTHLRLGDAMNWGAAPEKSTIYFLTLNDYEKVVLYIKTVYDFKKIIIICGSHSNVNKKESLEYLQNITKIWEKHNFNVEIDISNNPDIDFCKLTRASNFLKGKGDFLIYVLRYHLIITIM